MNIFVAYVLTGGIVFYYKEEYMNDFITDYQAWIVKQLLELKSKSDAYKASAAYNTAVQLLESITIFIAEYKKTGDNKAMQKVQFGEIIDLNDIPRKEAENSVKKMIKEQALKIPKGKAQIVKLEKWGTFSNAVKVLKDDGDISKDFKAMKRGDQFLLVHE